MVSKLADWPYSSFLDLYGKRNGNLAENELCKDIFQLTLDDLTDFNLGISDPPYLKK